MANENELAVRGITDGGKAVKDRIKDAVTARGLFGKLKAEDNLASSFRANIAGQINGNPPRNPAEMRRLGLGGFSNVNFREAEAIIEMNASSFWDLDMNVPQFIQCKVYDERKLAIPDELMYGEIIAGEYTRMLKEWQGYFYNRMLSVKEMLKYGIGPVVWQNEWTWKFRALPCGSVLFPSKAEALTQEPELMMVRDTMYAGDLYALIETDEDKEAAEDAGWNVSEVKDAILRAQKNRLPESKRMGVLEWEAIQQQLKNNSFHANHITCNEVSIVHIFVRDIDKEQKITHYIITEDEDREDFLYKKNAKYDSMYNTACLFLADVGDGYIRSVKGLGQKTYPHIAQSNRFLNHMVNSGYLSGSLMISTPQPNNLSLTQFGPVTVLPQHAQPMSQQFMPNMEHLARVRDVLSNVLEANTGVMKRGTSSLSKGPTKTAHEVNVEDMRNTRLEKTSINIHYLQLDALHREIMRRALNPDYPKYIEGYDEAMEFRERCEARGVPKEFLKMDRLGVTAMRSVGYGSALAMNQVSGEMLSISDRMPVIGQNNALRDFISSRVGYDMVDRYAPVVTMRDVPNSETSVATLENNAIVTGMETLVGADQPHPIHVPIHLKLLNEVAQAYMEHVQSQQVDVVKTFEILMRGLQHVGQHLEYWSRDPSRKQEREQAEENVKQLAQLAKRLEGEAMRVQQEREQMMREQAMQQQELAQASQDPELAIKREKMLREVEIKRENMLRQNEIRKERTQKQMELSNVKAAADIARKGMTR
jgi:hypothetical protein